MRAIVSAQSEVDSNIRSYRQPWDQLGHDIESNSLRGLQSLRRMLQDALDPLHHGRRRPIEFLDQSLNIRAAGEVEIDLALVGVGAEFAVVHGLLEGRAQYGDD